MELICNANCTVTLSNLMKNDTVMIGNDNTYTFYFTSIKDNLAVHLHMDGVIHEINKPTPPLYTK